MKGVPFRKQSIEELIEYVKPIINKRSKTLLSSSYQSGLKQRIKNVAAQLQDNFDNIVLVRRSYSLLLEPMFNYIKACTSIMKAMIEYDLYLIEHPGEFEQAYRVGFEDLVQ